MSDEVTIYVDGSCDNAYVGHGTFRGAWCCILLFNGKERMVTGTELGTTNQRMEISGLVQVIPHLLKNGFTKIKIISDSMYVVNGINRREKWKKKKQIANPDLWWVIYNAIDSWAPEYVEAMWVKGHSGNEYNERCDIEANKLIGVV